MNMKVTLATTVSILALSGTARAAARYELTITNGALMPISPAVIYAKVGGESAAGIGTVPTAGFIKLCQTGNNADRAAEIKGDTTLQLLATTTSVILPGESRVVSIDVPNPLEQSVEFEAMYGKSKDACGEISINSHSLVALKQHVTKEIVVKDNAVSTGAFKDSALPAGMTYLDPSVCVSAMDAVSCLRELAVATPGQLSIRSFAGYFPSLISALEMKYGADDTRTLLIPTSGAIQIKAKLVQ